MFCDIKRLGTGKGSDKGPKRDLALIVSERPATAAGMFTTNQVCAAPVKVCVERVKKGTAQAVVVNSGNANACTGKQGMADAREMVSFTERALNVPKGAALVGSTGRIGVTMPMDHVRAGIIEASTLLGATAKHSDHAAEAIMTSDSRPKQIAVEFKLGGKTVRIGGICKGAGMIQPGMSPTGARPATLPYGGLHATMLGFVTTDAVIDAKVLQRPRRRARARQRTVERMALRGTRLAARDGPEIVPGSGAGAEALPRAWPRPALRHRYAGNLRAATRRAKGR